MIIKYRGAAYLRLIARLIAILREQKVVEIRRMIHKDETRYNTDCRVYVGNRSSGRR
jgi:hypothetical protein